MEPVQSSLCFLGYNAELLRFEKREATVRPSGDSVTLRASFLCEIIQENQENQYSLRLGAKIDQPDIPFYVEVILVGHFTVNGNTDNIDQMMKVNAAAILYPYVRSTLSTMTNLAGIPPITLPTLNIAQMFQNERQSNAKSHQN